MLNTEIIKSQEGLNDLTEDQLKTIATLANNTIKSEVATEKGKVLGRFDADIESLTGITKTGQPTHVFLKEAFASKLAESGQNPELQNTIDSLQTKISELQNAGDSSGALKAELDKQAALVEQLRADQVNAAKEWETKLAEKDQKYNGTLVDNAFNEALAGLKFKDEALIPASVRNAFISQVKGELLNKYKTTFNESGGIEFLDADGKTVRNAENAQYPFTAKELFAKSLESILDTGKQAKGGGAVGGESKKVNINISEASTQVQADEIIVGQLLADGMVKGTPEFSNKHAEIRTANNIKSLPIQ